MVKEEPIRPRPHATTPGTHDVHSARAMAEQRYLPNTATLTLTKADKSTEQKAETYVKHLTKCNEKNGVDARKETLFKIADAFSKHNFPKNFAINYRNEIAIDMQIRNHDQFMIPELFDAKNGRPTKEMRDSLGMVGEYTTLKIGQYLAKKEHRSSTENDEDKKDEEINRKLDKYWNKRKNNFYYIVGQQEEPLCPNAINGECGRAIRLWGLSNGTILQSCCEDYDKVIVTPCFGQERKRMSISTDTSPQRKRLKELQEQWAQDETDPPTETTTALPEEPAPKVTNVILQDPTAQNAPLMNTIRLPSPKRSLSK